MEKLAPYATHVAFSVALSPATYDTISDLGNIYNTKPQE